MSSFGLLLKTLREQQKQKFKDALVEVTNCKEFKQCQQALGLMRYKFVVLTESMKYELLNGASFAFSAEGKHASATLFDLNVQWRKIMFLPKIEHLIKTGLCIVVVQIPETHANTNTNTNTNTDGTAFGTVVGSVAALDFCDRAYPKAYQRRADFPLRFKHKAEVADHVVRQFADEEDQKRHHPLFKQLCNIDTAQSVSLLSTHFGQWVESDLFWCAPTLRQRGLMLLLSRTNALVLRSIGAVFHVARITNVRSLAFTKSVNDGPSNPTAVFLDTVKFREFVCADGTRVSTYFDALQSKHALTDDEMEAQWNHFCQHLGLFSLANLSMTVLKAVLVRDIQNYIKRTSRSRL